MAAATGSFRDVLTDRWVLETFTVVSAGDGVVALQTASGTYLRANADGSVDQTPAAAAAGRLPPDWPACRFTVVDAGDSEVALLSYRGTFIRAAGDTTVRWRSRH